MPTGVYDHSCRIKPRVATPCKTCGKDQSFLPSEARKYCSDTCRAAARVARRISRTCELCGASFSLLPSEARKQPGKFCSISCRSGASRKRPKRQGMRSVAHPIPVIDRLERFYIPEPNSGCWLWIGAMTNTGYGMFKAVINGNKFHLAHRASYVVAKGDIPPGLELDHLCKTPCCINPEHLEPVTHQVNMSRWEQKNHKNRKKTHCQHGHPFTPENTKVKMWRGAPTRHCIICLKTRGQYDYARRKARLALQAGAAS